RATSPTDPSDVERTEAEQLKIVLKRSRHEMHISQQGGSSTDEGTGSKPRTPTSVAPLPITTPTMTSSTIATTTTTSLAPILPTTIPSDIIQNLPSFGSLFRFDDKLRSLEQNFFEVMQTNHFAGAVSAIPEIVQHYMDQRMNEAVKVAIQIQSDRLRDDDDADQEVVRDDDKDDDEEGGDDEHESDEETQEEESFDPIPQTPEENKDEGDGEEDLGLNIGKEERHDEDKEEDELYQDVNINQGRGLQGNLEVEDTHVTLTPVKPDGRQENSSVSSQFVTSM
nr:hypothetical protein [Tanacetum cinerariifolium]